LTALISPIGLVVGAVATASVLIIRNWDKISAYFTTGAGAEVFQTVLRAVKITFGQIVNTLKFLKEQFTEVFDFIGNIFTGDFKGALDNLGRMFENTFGFIWDTVKSVVANMTNYLGQFFKWLGLSKWGDGLQNWAEEIAPKFDALDNVVDKVSKGTKELNKTIKDTKYQRRDWETLWVV